IWGDAEVRVEDGQGNYVGVDENGFLHKGLPDVTYQAEEGGTTVTLPLGVSYRLVIEHTGARLPQITAVDFAAPALDLAFTAQAQALFLDLPTGEGKIAVLENSGGSLLELRVGLANAPDGKPTQMLAPDTVLTDPES